MAVGFTIRGLCGEGVGQGLVELYRRYTAVLFWLVWPDPARLDIPCSMLRSVRVLRFLKALGLTFCWITPAKSTPHARASELLVAVHAQNTSQSNLAIWIFRHPARAALLRHASCIMF